MHELALYVARAVKDGVYGNRRDVTLVDNQVGINGKEEKRKSGQVSAGMAPWPG
jgi:hypothetical protein